MMSQARIVVVEDEILVAESIRDKLVQLGYEVPALVTLGEEAVIVAGELQPDLVLMDIKLAGKMDGVQAAEEIRARFGIPVVYLTAFVDDESLQRARITAPFGYLLKPFRTGDLRSTIEMALYKREVAEELWETQQFIQGTFDALSANIAILDDSGTIVAVNASWRRFADANGLDWPDYAVGRNYLEVCESASGPDAALAARAAVGIRQLMAGQHDEFSLEYPCHGPAEERWFVMRVTRFQGGEPIRVVVAHENITERKRAEQASRESEERWRSLADNSPDHIVTLDENLCIEYVNRPSPGLTVGELIGTPLHTYVVQDRQDEIRGILERVLRAGEPASYETEYDAPDGSAIYYESRVVPRVVSGKIVGLVVTARDITRRRRVEEELRKLSRAVSQSPSTVVITDVQGNIEYVNPRFTQITGYAAEEVVGQNPRILKSGAQPPELYAELWATITAGGEWRGEFINRKKNGEMYWELASISPIRNAEGVITHFLKVAEDITQRHWAEEALRQRTVELQSRNEELDAFAHTVAHDLQNPLGLIMGYAEILAEAYDTLSDENLERYLNVIARNSRKMSSIISELLLLAGVRKADVEMVPLDMAGIVAEALQRLAALIKDHQAEIVLPDTWPDAMGYGPWVEEVWANYLSNALKYGGRPPRVELGAEAQADGMVRFWVRDNGAGLAPEDQARLFVPFTRLAQARIEGQGLGLSIVQRIAQKLGGQVGVESSGIPGEGCLFFFTLPTAAEEPEVAG